MKNTAVNQNRQNRHKTYGALCLIGLLLLVAVGVILMAT